MGGGYVSFSSYPNCWGVFVDDDQDALESIATFNEQADAELFVKAKYEYSNSNKAS